MQDKTVKFEIFFIHELRPSLNGQSDSIYAKVFNYIFTCFSCMFLLSVYTCKNFYTSYVHNYIYIFLFFYSTILLIITEARSKHCVLSLIFIITVNVLGNLYLKFKFPEKYVIKSQVGCTLILQLRMQTNLGWNVRMLNGLLKVRHEHQITCLKPAIMQCMVIDVAKHCSCADSIRSVTGVNEFTHFVKTFRGASNIFFRTFLSFLSLIRLFLGIW